jgi:hypothetical protein
MTPLEEELVDLGEHLDHRQGADLVASVERRIASERSGVPVWAKVAAAIILALAIALTVPTSRRALARWLGIGAIEVRTVPTTLPSGPPARTVPGAPPSSVVTTASTTALSTTLIQTTAGSTSSPTTDPLDAVRQALTFRPLVAAADAGPIQRVETDTRVPGGLVAMTYSRFTLVELAADPQSYPVMMKLVPPGATVSSVSINDAAAEWVEGAHEIAYVAPDGTVRNDTVRRSGNVLVWTVGSVTLRIEGLDSIDEALHVAGGIG